MQNSHQNRSTDSNLARCLYCGQPAQIVWVHGHGQCANCGINTDECCRGESCDTDLTDSPLTSGD